MEDRHNSVEKWILDNETAKIEDVFKVTQKHLAKALGEKKMRRFVPDTKYQTLSDAYLACLVLFR